MANGASGTARTDTRGRPVPLTITPLARERRGLRVFVFYSWAVLLTGAVSMLFADLLWRTGWSGSRTFLLILFVVLFFFSAVGCVQGVYGFIARLFGDRQRITRLVDYKSQSLEGASTAIVVP